MSTLSPPASGPAFGQPSGRRPRRLIAATVAVCTVTATGLALHASAAAPAVVLLSSLASGRATVPASFVLRDDTGQVSETKVYDAAGSSYLGGARKPPFDVSISLTPGAHALEVRHVVGGSAQRLTDTVTVPGGPSADPSAAPTSPPAAPTSAAPPSEEPTPAEPTPTPAASSAPASAAPVPPAPAPTDVPVAAGRTVPVSTVAELEGALAAAVPGDVIRLADGTYTRHGGDRWSLAASGREGAPITLVGSRAAVLTSDGTGGDYAVHVTGSWWRISGLSVRNATKGIVLDGSQHTVIDSVDVGDIGDEAVHFRACSSDGVLQDSTIHDTGLRSPQYGEGVYVGSANSNWSKYSCADGRDNSERNLVQRNVFTHIAAEGADLKEGTDSGTLLDNVFDDTGYSGKNSADSAVDAKGNGWLIEGNMVRNPQGADLDGFQSHSVYGGYGTGNVFRGNAVQGPWPGAGFGLYPPAGNTVSCDNTAPDAARGLVTASSKPAACTG